MVKNREINGTEEIALVTPTPGRKAYRDSSRRDQETFKYCDAHTSYKKTQRYETCKYPFIYVQFRALSVDFGRGRYYHVRFF